MVVPKSLEQARDLRQEIIGLFHTLQQIPESSFSEQRTLAFVAHNLTSWGFTFKPIANSTSLVAKVGTGDGER